MSEIWKACAKIIDDLVKNRRKYLPNKGKKPSYSLELWTVSLHMAVRFKLGSFLAYHMTGAGRNQTPFSQSRFLSASNMRRGRRGEQHSKRALIPYLFSCYHVSWFCPLSHIKAGDHPHVFPLPIYCLAISSTEIISHFAYFVLHLIYILSLTQ